MRMGGMFLGGLAQGAQAGLKIGSALRGMADEGEIRDTVSQGQADAAATREQMISDKIQTEPNAEAAPTPQASENPDSMYAKLGLANQEPQMSTPADAPEGIAEKATKGLSYTVGDKKLSTEEDARKEASKGTPSAEELFIKNAVPKVEAMYLKQGNLNGAKAWREYATSETSQKKMNEWAKASRMAAMGDADGVADYVFNTYKDDYPDGITPISKEAVKDKDGKLTGFNVKMKNDGTGEEIAQFIDSSSLLNMAAMSLPQAFDMRFKQQQQADIERLKNASEEVKDARKYSRDVAMEGIKHGNQLEEKAVSAQLDAASPGTLEKDMRALKGVGYSEEELKSLAGQKFSGEYGKAPNPITIRKEMWNAAMKSNPFVQVDDGKGARSVLFSTLPPAQQKNYIEQQAIAVEESGRAAMPGSARGGLAPSGAPAQQGSAAPQQRPKGIPVFDTKTGKVVYR